jgi:hypothetical protein
LLKEVRRSSFGVRGNALKSIVPLPQEGVRGWWTIDFGSYYELKELNS